jgi:dipeptidase D
VNLDSEEDGKLTVGCAGSTDTWVRVDAQRAAAGDGATALTVKVSGGQGGHSGSGIALGRSNAIKVLGRALREAHAQTPFRLVSLNGGKSRNAIPRDATAVISVEAGLEAPLRAALATANEAIRDAYKTTDSAVAVSVEAARSSAEPWTEDATTRLLDAIALVPTGPLAMSPDFDDLVETSTSLGEAITENGRLTLHSLSRSSNDSALPEVIASLDAVARLAGGELEVKHNYNGWRPNLDSRALASAKSVYERLFGEPPVVTGVHAGLETAVIGSKVPGLDMISFGPQIEFPHSPDERVSIPTVERFWKLLVAFVDDISTPRGSG